MASRRLLCRTCAAPGMASYVMGQRGGTETVALNANQLPAHSHAVNAISSPLASSGGGSIYDSGTGGNGVDSQLKAGAVRPSGGGQPLVLVSHHMPYLTMNWPTATQGIYPSRL